MGQVIFLKSAKSKMKHSNVSLMPVVPILSFTGKYFIYSKHRKKRFKKIRILPQALQYLNNLGGKKEKKKECEENWKDINNAKH